MAWEWLRVMNKYMIGEVSELDFDLDPIFYGPNNVFGGSALHGYKSLTPTHTAFAICNANPEADYSWKLRFPTSLTGNLIRIYATGDKFSHNVDVPGTTSIVEEPLGTAPAELAGTLLSGMAEIYVIA